MMDQIARAIANVVIFLEYSSPDILDEDFSIEALEQLAGDLQALDETSRTALAASFRLIAPTYKGDIETFVAALPESLGISRSEEDEDFEL
ncbi:hypothetical protein RZN05_18680 [Sphingomonas sp. HF-S4]|uniref:Uncharacterized protein n=1 Tax=Sphingomonas agrestis TaxID=3080540 RepID=A0ABU3YCA3_9SPHN|nr:hypothetical protein [Sphingomonas sp. HF-S4]MDV3459031.1 hypothetical protein [Sphingomonas sp. HF-S4]